VIDIGIIEDVGYVGQNPSILRSFRTSGIRARLADKLQPLIARSTSSSAGYISSCPADFTNPNQISIGCRSTMPFGSPENPIIWQRDPRAGIHYNLEDTATLTGSKSTNEGFKQFAACAVDPSKLNAQSSVEYLAQHIGVRLMSFLLKEGEEVDLGMTVEEARMNRWWRLSTGISGGRIWGLRFRLWRS